MLIHNQPAFKGIVTAGPITEKTSMAQDGVMAGYVAAFIDQSKDVKVTQNEGKLELKGTINKILFSKVLNQEAFQDLSESKAPRNVSMTLTDDTFEMKYNYPEYPQNNWFDTLTWKIDKKEEKHPDAYKAFIAIIKHSFDRAK